MKNDSDDDFNSSSDADKNDYKQRGQSKGKHASQYNSEIRRKIDEKLERRRLKEEFGYYDH